MIAFARHRVAPVILLGLLLVLGAAIVQAIASGLAAAHAQVADQYSQVRITIGDGSSESLGVLLAIPVSVALQYVIGRLARLPSVRRHRWAGWLAGVHAHALASVVIADVLLMLPDLWHRTVSAYAVMIVVSAHVGQVMRPGFATLFTPQRTEP